MAMSRKHYTEVAEIIKRQAGNFADNSGASVAIGRIAEDLAGMFKRDNSAFDRQRFLDACGL